MYDAKSLRMMSTNNQNSIEIKEKQTKPALNFLLMGAGSMFTSMVIAGFLVGYAFDWLFDTTPLFLLACGVLGFIGGTMKVHKLLNKMDLMYDFESKENDGMTDSQPKEQK